MDSDHKLLYTVNLLHFQQCCTSVIFHVLTGPGLITGRPTTAKKLAYCGPPDPIACATYVNYDDAALNDEKFQHGITRARSYQTEIYQPAWQVSKLKNALQTFTEVRRLQLQSFRKIIFPLCTISTLIECVIVPRKFAKHDYSQALCEAAYQASSIRMRAVRLLVIIKPLLYAS